MRRYHGRKKSGSPIVRVDQSTVANVSEASCSAGRDSRESAMEGSSKQPPAMISQEGPLRSITTPPFSGPVAFKDSGPLASAASSSAFPTREGALANPLRKPMSDEVQVSSQQTPPTPPLQPPTTHGSLKFTSQQSQRASFSTPLPAMSSPFYAATSPMPADVFSRDSSSRAEPGNAFHRIQQGPSSTPGSGEISMPPPQLPPPTYDPLSHLLQDGIRGSPEQEKMGAREGAALLDPLSQGGDYHRPMPSASVAAGGAPVTSQPQGIATLAPPPQAYPGSSTQAAPAAVYDQQHQPPPPQTTAVLSAVTPPVAYAQRKERSLEELVSDFLTPNAPSPPESTDEDSAMGDPRGWVAALGRLARRRAWMTLVEVTGTMLVVHRAGGAQTLTPEQAMSVRLRRAMALIRIGKGPEAVEAAIEAGQEVGQVPLAPLTIASRLAAASAKAVCDREFATDAVDDLNALKLVLDEVIAGASDSSSPMGGDGDEARVLSTAEARVWRRRVISALANTFVRRGDWRLALDLLETLGKEVCTPAAACDHDDDGGGGAGDTSAGDPSRDGVTAHHRESVISASRVEVLSRIGRIFLQIGAIKDAELFFRRAEEAVAAGDAGDGQAVGDNARILVNRGLLLFSKNDFVSAQENFEKAATAAAAKHCPRKESEDDWEWVSPDESTGLLGSALNNLSLAMVYSCDVMRGVRTLEDLIRRDPMLYMLDVVVFNLCTLYDLSFDPTASATKKRMLQGVAQRYLLEDIDPASFRVPVEGAPRV